MSRGMLFDSQCMYEWYTIGYDNHCNVRLASAKQQSQLSELHAARKRKWKQ